MAKLSEAIHLLGKKTLDSRYAAANGKPGKSNVFPVFQLFGDSITQQNTLTQGGQPTFASIGYFTWAQGLSGNRVSYSPAGNFGIAGNTTIDMLARLNQVLAYAADACIVNGGINDVGASMPANEILSRLYQMYDAISSSRTLIILQLLPSGYAMTASKLQILSKVQAGIRRYVASNKKCYLIDPSPYLVDQNSAVSAPFTIMNSDLLHPSPTGAFYIGRDIGHLIDKLFPKYPTKFVSPVDVYDAVNNPAGNLLANGCLAGSSAVSGSGRSGTVPTGWDVARLSGTGAITTTAQAKALTAQSPAPGFECVLAASLATQSSYEAWALTQTINAGPTTYATGDQVWMEGEFEVTGTTLNCSSISANLIDNDGVTSVVCADMNSPNQNMPNESYLYYFKTPVRTIAAYAGSGTQRIIVRVQIALNATVSASVTVAIRNIALRKVA